MFTKFNKEKSGGVRERKDGRVGSGSDTGEACCWMQIASYWHLGRLTYPPHAPQPVGLTPVGRTCLLSVGTDLGDVHLLIHSVLRSALQSRYACYGQGNRRKPRLREVK